MKLSSLFLLFTCYLNSNSYAQTNGSNAQLIAQKVVTGLFEGLSELDVNKMRSFCTPDVTILETGKVWNFDSLALRTTLRKAKSVDFKRVNQIDLVETKFSGDIIWVSYFNQATITSGGKMLVVKWLESAVLKKDKGEWKISLLHSTEL